MPYRVRPFAPVTDDTYPSEVAGQRPLLATRIHCEASENDAPDHPEGEDQFSLTQSIRGDRANNECDRMNEVLNSGRGIGRSGRGRP